MIATPFVLDCLVGLTKFLMEKLRSRDDEYNRLDDVDFRSIGQSLKESNTSSSFGYHKMEDETQVDTRACNMCKKQFWGEELTCYDCRSLRFGAIVDI